MKSFITRVLNSLGEGSANLIAGALIYLLYKSAAGAGFYGDFFKAVLYEHIAHKSLTLFIAISWVLWAVWAILCVRWAPRHKGSKMFRAANKLGRYDQFVFSLYCTVIGVCAAAFVVSLANLSGGFGPALRYAVLAGLLLLLSLFLPTFWLQPGDRDLPSIFAPRNEVNAAAVTAHFVVALLLIPPALYLIVKTVLGPIQFVID